MKTNEMNPTSKLQIASIIGKLLLLYICFLRGTDAGGKGKGGRQGHIIIQNDVKDGNRIVPIYMPIPIPVPMPMGSSDSYRHHNHHSQQQHQQDSEGEVKKIYLLQPIPKINPQLKGGGYMGPVQTHIHLPSPVMPHPAHRQHHPYPQPQKAPQSYDGDTGGLQEQAKRPYEGGDGGGSKSSYSHEHSGMKILPIVVIPPIAPIPPVQLQNEGNPPRVSLSPQINNYLSSELHRDRFPRNHHERKSQSESYGGSGGGTVFRETLGSRGRLRNRQGPARNKYQDDYSDDYDYGSSTNFLGRLRSNSNTQRNSRGAQARRRLYSDLNARSARMSGQDSIRDIIDHQVQFDDAPERPYSISRLSECCGEARNPSRLSHLIDSASEQVDLREPATSYSGSLHPRSYSSTRGRLQPESNTFSSNLGELSDYTGESRPLNKASSDLTYYDHDLAQAPESAHFRETKLPRRSYLDEHDSLDNDEWVFDTIKSVKHIDPATNGTITDATNLNITTIPPKNTTISE